MYRGGGGEDRRGKDNFVSFFLSFFSLESRYNSLTLYYIYVYVCVYLFFPSFFFLLQTTCRLFSRGSRGFSNSLLEKRGSHSRQNILLVERLSFFSFFYSFFPFFFLFSFFLFFFFLFSFFVTNQRRVKASQTIGH